MRSSNVSQEMSEACKQELASERCAHELVNQSLHVVRHTSNLPFNDTTVKGKDLKVQSIFPWFNTFTSTSRSF
jgi:hypothetical protein